MSDVFRVGPCLVEPSLNTISRKGKTTRLEPKVMEVLVCLARHPGETLPKEKLLQSVWPDTFVTEDVLKHSISELRRVFEDDAREPHVIQTIPKRGYRLLARVEPVNGGERSSPPPAPNPVSSRAAGMGARTLWIGAVAIAAAALLAVLLITFKGSRVREWLAGTSGASPIHSIAVLPLQNLSGDPGQEYFSDGMTDALITDLAQIGSVKVISRTSSMRYKKTDKSLPQIARELNVDGIIEGTVQRSGDRVRITAQLVDGPSDKHIWANSYERDTRDVFALERDVTQEIARQVRERLRTTNRMPPLPRPRPVNLKALEAYLQGNYDMNRGSGDEGMRKAEQSFQQAIDADPNYAPAYVGMAYSHYLLLRSTTGDGATRRAAAEKAVALDPSSSDAHSALGDMKFADWDWPGAEEELRRAILLNPNNASAHSSLCVFLDATGRLDESLSECQTAQQLDPNYDHLSETMEARGQYNQAVELLRSAIERHPDDGFLHYFLYRDYCLNGMYKESIHELEQSLTLVGYSGIASRVHRAFATSGYRGALRQWAKDLEHVHATNQIFLPRLAAEVYAQLGDNNRAFFWLEQGYEHHDRIGAYGGINWMMIEHELDPLHSDPRWGDLVRRVGLKQ